MGLLLLLAGSGTGEIKISCRSETTTTTTTTIATNSKLREPKQLQGKQVTTKLGNNYC
jgi:hypothetical protein